MTPHCEFCEHVPTRIHIPEYGPARYGCRLSCDRHRHWVRRLIHLDMGPGPVHEIPGCVQCDGPVTADRLSPGFATPTCHGCLPRPEPLPILGDPRRSL